MGKAIPKIGASLFIFEMRTDSTSPMEPSLDARWTALIKDGEGRASRDSGRRKKSNGFYRNKAFRNGGPCLFQTGDPNSSDGDRSRIVLISCWPSWLTVTVEQEAITC